MSHPTNRLTHQPLNSEDPESWEAAIAAFERDWNTNPPAAIAQHAGSAIALLDEFVSVDLEYRWRSERGSLQDELSCQPRLEDYVRHFKKMGFDFTPTTAMIVEEYRVRSIWGDRPPVAHFEQRFPSETTLAKLFAQTDAELHAERTTAKRREVAFDIRAPLPYEDFEILQLIGMGGVGKVYRSRQLSLNRLVALKALRKSYQREEWVVDSFLREGQIVAGLRHPGIAELFGMGRFPHGGYFQVMELLEGSNLRQRLDGTEKLNQEYSLKILYRLSDTLRFAHAKQVIHCDLKPENIMLSDDRVVLLDFGMAQHDTHRSVKEILGGTPRFMAPELSTDAEATAAIDIYAVGKIWEQMQASATQPEPESLTSLRSKCISQDPSERPSAEQLATELNEVINQLY